MKLSKIILPGLLLALAACGKKEDAKETQKTGIPEKLSFQKSAPGAKLSKSQVAEIKSTFSNKSMMILPPGELIFPSKNISQEEIRAKESELYQQDQNAYSLLKEMQKGCGKTHPTIKFDATFPIDGDITLESLKVGDRMGYSLSGLLNGSNCPVKASVEAGLNAEVTQVDQANKTGTASASLLSNTTGIMLAPKYAKLLGARGIIVNSNLSGLGAVRDTLHNGLITYNLTGSYFSLENEIPYSMQVQMLSKAMTENVSAVEVTLKTTLKMPNFDVTIEVHGTGTSDSEKNQEVAYYVNGHQMTKFEIEELFGSNNPALSAEANPVYKTLK